MLCSLLLLGLFCATFWIGTLRLRGRNLFVAISASLLALTAAGLHIRASAFVPPVKWLVAGRNETWFFAGAIGLLAGFLTVWMRSVVFRTVTAILCGLFVLRFAILPHLGGVLARPEMARLPGKIRNDICRQTSPITCGPAAAVTALWHLGIPATEAEIAVLAGTSVFGGTPEDVLAETLAKNFVKSGLRVEIGYHQHFPALQSGEIALTAINLGGFTDHFLCILKADETSIKIADPLGGVIREESRLAFERDWKNIVILLRREIP